MNILFYSPLQSRSRDTESVMEGLVKAGDNVYLLTQYSSEIYHDAVKKFGVFCTTTPVNGTETWTKKVQQIFFLIRFCKSNKIDIVYAQLEPANFIAVFAQYFIKAKVVLVRHHVDLMETDSTRLAHRISILTYSLAKYVVVVSNRAKDYMVSREKIRIDKIQKINLGYNFSLWPTINSEFVRNKRISLGTDFVLVTAARLVKSKRVDVTIMLLKRLRDQGLNCSLMILGDGYERVELEKIVLSNGLKNYVSFEGYVENVVDYMAIGDITVHLSVTESSAAVVRESGLAKRPVIVCRDVGDFNDYLAEGVNAFFVDKQQPLEEAVDKAIEFLTNKTAYQDLGPNLYNSVIKNFSIESVLPLYQRLNQELVNG